MYKVMLVDDEQIFIEYMQGLLDWRSFSCTLSATASDGDTAWEKILEVRPDILFLDINIPGPNGLELCRRLREEKIPCEVIIVSAYSDFDFAKKALQNGVVDYVLKPFDEQELTTALVKGISRVQDERGKFLRRCIDGLEKWENDCLMAVVRSESPDLLAQIRKICTSMEQKGLSVWGMISGKDGYLAIRYQEQKTDLIEILSMCIDETSILALGDVTKELTVSLHHAKAAMENRALHPGCVIPYEELKIPDTTMFSQSEFVRLIGYLENEEYTQASSLIRRLFGLEEAIGISFQYFLSVYSSLSLFMMHHYGKSRADAEKILGQQNSILRELSAANRVEDIAAVIENAVYELYSDCIHIAPLTRRGELVEKINRYIEMNYMQKRFTVEKMANALLFENSYIRRIYKNETGITILRALENYRIQKAKELLEKRCIRHSEIADAIGFSDQYYFSKRFKQIVGCTPTEYEVMKSND